MTNFDFLLSEKKFAKFASAAVTAEKILHIEPVDPEAVVMNCRRAMEIAVKWMYSVDSELSVPFDENLRSLLNDSVFHDVVGDELKEFTLKMGELTDDEREIILKGCLINYYRG